MRKILAAFLIAIMAAMALPATPAFADPPPWAPAQGRRAHDLYDGRGYYIHPRVLKRNDVIWLGRDGRYHCRRENGTTGLIIGAAVGALVGNRLADRRHRTVGTIIGRPLEFYFGMTGEAKRQRVQELLDQIEMGKGEHTGSKKKGQGVHPRRTAEAASTRAASAEGPSGVSASNAVRNWPSARSN